MPTLRTVDATPYVLPPAESSSTGCCALSDKVCEVVKWIFSPLVGLYHWIAPINPVTKTREIRLLPFCLEKKIGEWAYPGLVEHAEGEILESDPEFGDDAKLVREVGEALAKKCPRSGLEFEFKLLRSREINAWCLPGGKVGVNLGLLAALAIDKNTYGIEGFNPTLAEKVAAVLSHEIIHAAARHSGRKIEFSLFMFMAFQAVKYAFSYFARSSYDEQIAAAEDNPEKVAQLRRLQAHATYSSLGFLDPLISIFSGGLGLCSGRGHEFEADKYGMHLYAEMDEVPFTKDSPKAAIWLMHFFVAHHSSKTGTGWLDWIKEWFDTHPCPEDRLAENLKTWKILNVSAS